MKTALIIPVHNRAYYVSRCLNSLLNLSANPDMVILVDDHSTEPEVKPLLDGFKLRWSAKFVITHAANKGVRQSLIDGIDKAFANGAEVVINLDSDAVVKPDFIQRLISLQQHTGIISSGFNFDSANNPVLEQKEGYVTRKYCNGINMCFNKKQYQKHIKPALQSHGNWDYNTSTNVQAFAITSPSVVQHLGIYSSLGHNHQPADYAQDFKFLSLPDVTLFGIDSHDSKGLLRAAAICQRDIEFGGVKLITEDLFTKGGDTETRRRDYSKWMLKELNNYFDTSHVLTIHPDGYVLNWESWDNSLLQYDYIGATWWYKDNMNVGNGGFSLRSKKLCKVLADCTFDQYHPEDHVICRVYRDDLEKKFGIKFAPEEVANRFSIEAFGIAPKPGNEYSGQFGFHGPHVDFSLASAWNIPNYLLYKK